MEIIDVINYFLGGLFILLGFIIHKNPNLIAGYNTMPKDEKETFDITGFKQLLKTTLIIGGLFFIVGNFICFVFSWNIVKIFISFLPGLAIPLFLVYKSKNYYSQNNIKSKSYPSKKNIKYKPMYLMAFFGFLILIILGSFFIYAPKEPNISISNKKVVISGFYGFEIPINDIKSIEITDFLPKILLRTNGLGLGNIRKGYFKVENYGICKLFLQVDSSPYLKIIYLDDKIVYLNFKDKNKTIKSYNELLKITTPDKIEK